MMYHSISFTFIYHNLPVSDTFSISCLMAILNNQVEKLAASIGLGPNCRKVLAERDKILGIIILFLGPQNISQTTKESWHMGLHASKDLLHNGKTMEKLLVGQSPQQINHLN